MADEELSGTGRPVRFLCAKEKNENHLNEVTTYCSGDVHRI